MSKPEESPPPPELVALLQSLLSVGTSEYSPKFPWDRGTVVTPLRPPEWETPLSVGMSTSMAATVSQGQTTELASTASVSTACKRCAALSPRPLFFLD